MNPPGITRLHLLDGLRGLAAISVLLYHVHNAFGTGRWFQSGYIAVDLFFLLSGFILTVIAEPRMHDGLSALAFFTARIRRLWPMIALGTLVGGATHYCMHDSTGAALAIATLFGLLLLPALGRSGEIYPLNGPQWSLLWELLANLAHGAILVRLRTQTLLAIVVLSGGALFAAIVLRGGDTFGANGDFWWLASIRVLFSYGAGIVIARGWRDREGPPLAPWWLALAAPFALILALPLLALPIGQADAVVVTMVFPLLFWLAVHADQAPVRAAVWMQRLGALSFPLYGVHLPLLVLFAWFDRSVASALMAVGSAILLASAIAWLSARLGSTRRRRAADPAGSLQSA